MKERKSKRANDLTSRVSATDQQASTVASAFDDRDRGDSSQLHKSSVFCCSATDEQATRGVGASDIVGAGDSGLQEKGMPSSSFTSDQQANHDDATDSDPLENYGILCADSSFVRVDAEAVTSSDITQVSLMPDRLGLCDTATAASLRN